MSFFKFNKALLPSVISSTIASVLLSNVIACVLFWATGFQEWAIGLFCSTVIPLIVSPIVTYRIYSLTYELSQAKNCMELLAITDDLTGVFNKRYSMELIKRELSLANRYHYPLTLAIIDVDNFKSINDHQGHLMGDHVLKKIGQLIKENLRTTDIVGRFGGDEFLVVFSHTDIHNAQMVTHRIHSIIQDSFLNDNAKKTSPTPTLSIGMAVLKSTNGNPLEELIQQADTALYKAKNSGKNKIMVFSPEEPQPDINS